MIGDSRDDAGSMTDFALGDTVYFAVWSDRNCGPPLTTEYSGTLVDNDYEPHDEDREADETGYLRPGRRYALVDLHSGWRPHVIVAATDLHTEPTPRPVPQNGDID
jgi:hypothetical protein